MADTDTLLNRFVNFFVVNQGKNRSEHEKSTVNYKKYYIADERTKTWLLSGSPTPLLTILATYLYFCLYAGPRWMKNRKPFQLKNTLIIYNAVQVVFSIILVVEVSLLDHKCHYFSNTQCICATRQSYEWGSSHVKHSDN